MAGRAGLPNRRRDRFEGSDGRSKAVFGDYTGRRIAQESTISGLRGVWVG